MADKKKTSPKKRAGGKKNGKKKNGEKKKTKKAAPAAGAMGSSMESFPVVSIGASAGGFEALTGFFGKVPENCGISFVIIQHLDPTQSSHLSGLLAKYTGLPIYEVGESMKIEKNTIYIIPPSKIMTVKDRVLNLSPLGKGGHPGISHNIDIFFRSAAEDLKESAIGVILSGTANDGTLGAKAIKAGLGMVMAQDPNTARYPGMPQSAIDAGVVDFILKPEEMYQAIEEYIDSYHGKKESRSREIDGDEKTLNRIFSLVRNRTNIDLTNYKRSTVNRRISRRMGMRGVDGIGDYLKFLKERPEEIDGLIRDFLINVTSFFRDGEAFDALKKHISENLLEDDGGVLRAWVPGCSTGEEAYSLAMIIRECLEERDADREVQIFGTDLDPEAIEAARRGLYSSAEASDIGRERLKKFFKRKDDQYQVDQSIREQVVFAQQDFINDPPFSNIDLISARNLLIYFNSDLQKKKLIPMMSYSLNRGGILFLGTAESIGEYGDDFETLDRRWKIYRAKNSISRRPPVGDIGRGWGRPRIPASGRSSGKDRKAEMHDGDRPESMLISSLEPSVLLDADYRVVYTHGDTGYYLRLPEGEPDMSILRLIRPELRTALSNCLNESSKRFEKTVREGLLTGQETERLRLLIVVKPVRAMLNERDRIFYIVSFFELPGSEGETEGDKGLSSRNRYLEDELKFTRESLRGTVEELETANEELRSANEEYQSANEELQSTNEELETSREELQSLNEELVTVNAEHQKKIEELYVANDDMKNLLNSTGIATVYIDNDMRLMRFTPKATELFHFIESDIGRPLRHINSRIEYSDIISSTQQVLDTLIPINKDIRTEDGVWYSMRIYPYRKTDNVIAGVVISFIDISSKLQFSRNVIDTIESPAILLNRDYHIVLANRAFHDFFETSLETIDNASLFDMEKSRWDLPGLRDMIGKVSKRNGPVEDLKIRETFREIGEKTLILNAKMVEATSGEESWILLTMEDVTGEGTDVYPREDEG